MQEQYPGRQTEADGIAKAIKLHAKLAGRLGESGHVTVQRVEYHGAHDEPAADF